MLFFITLIAILFHIYSLYLAILRYHRIKHLPKDLLGEEEKDNYMKVLMNNIKIFFAMGITSFAFSGFDLAGIEFLPPIIAIIITSMYLTKLLDEIDDYDLSIKDSEIVENFLKRTKEDARKKNSGNKTSLEVSDVEKTREAKVNNNEDKKTH